MEIGGITREMVYLCIGDDIEHVERSKIHVEYFKGIKYFTVCGFHIIRGESQIFCSCNESYCWHIFKLILDEDNAIHSQGAETTDN